MVPSHQTVIRVVWGPPAGRSVVVIHARRSVIDRFLGFSSDFVCWQGYDLDWGPAILANIIKMELNYR